ncbi:metal-sensitive transcriptional regulator [Spirochaeta cellobiosiphila]|uniref:metal-sensitive transcriptional regulator n=1 Tax=Spirochaeta cellobiosiphila TaxID=504483 RepID=UPI000412F26A|nr:metal-sensitive transcriptional regulator [Spirochaeta cellobiosiphila]
MSSDLKVKRKAHHPYETKEKMVNRLNRIEGQIRGIAKMINEDVYCDDILHQFMSVESAINGVKNSLLEAHLKSCVVHQIQEGQLEVVDELLNTISKMTK